MEEGSNTDILFIILKNTTQKIPSMVKVYLNMQIEVFIEGVETMTGSTNCLDVSTDSYKIWLYIMISYNI